MFKQKAPSLKLRAQISTKKQAKSGRGNRVSRDVRINVLFHQESGNFQSQVVLSPGLQCSCCPGLTVFPAQRESLVDDANQADDIVRLVQPRRGRGTRLFL